ncbi:hypothetical protein SKAU_G00085970 [Synaphobranchus kaupii]|uniref:Uncharacterized protein n=1 Tax=Synaphobranchus kaupii TaxID=118154 RepID=A0A9Q1J5N1_SYNKA|nr:hypothetical protein SKAU_G00085970 [Synaphobranchus kaupii]
MLAWKAEENASSTRASNVCQPISSLHYNQPSSNSEESNIVVQRAASHTKCVQPAVPSFHSAVRRLSCTHCPWHQSTDLHAELEQTGRTFSIGQRRCSITKRRQLEPSLSCSQSAVEQFTFDSTNK